MKILLLHQDLFFRGGQRVTAQLANGFVKMGHNVHVVVSKIHKDLQLNNPHKKSFALDEHVDFSVLPFRRAIWNVLPFAWLLRKVKPDVIISNAEHYNMCAVLAVKLAFVKIPIVYVEHNLLSKSTSKKFKYSLQRNAKIIAVSNGVKKALMETIPSLDDKIVKIYNPILQRKVVASSDVHPALLNKKEFTFVAAGGLALGKGFLQLIQAFAKFKCGGQKGHLIIFGEGPQEAELRALISTLHLDDVVILAGHTNNLIANFAKADALISASLQETFGMTLIEAMSVDLPVIAIDCPVGPAEILNNGKYGFLVKMWDEDEMVNVMRRVYNGERKSCKLDLDEFYEDYALNSYEKILREVVLT